MISCLLLNDLWDGTQQSKHTNKKYMMCMRTYYRGYLSGTAVVKMTERVPTPARCFPSLVFLLPSSHFLEGVLTLPGLPKLPPSLLRPGSLVPGSLSHLLLWLVQPCSTQRSFGYKLATGCSTSWNSIKILHGKNTLEKGMLLSW